MTISKDTQLDNNLDLDTKVLTSNDNGDISSSNSIPEGPSTISAKPKRTWRSYLWDTFDKSPEERRFLFKLDAVILSLASLGYFIKYLDQVNINSAFVSGMKEDLGLYGNELNYITTAWTVGYVLGEIPRYENTCTKFESGYMLIYLVT
jgi:ACS family pantothenate transporter-like MFS transporter